jgi:phosphatidylinositol alpha-1,6-mannosyltransferase
MEMMMQQLVSHLRTQMEVHVFGPYAGGEVIEESTTRPRRDGLAWFFLAAMVSCFQLLRRESFDVIIAGSTLVMPIVYVLGCLFKLPVAVNVYGLDLIYSHPLYQLMLTVLLKRFDRVFAISHASETEALKRGASPDDVVIVHPGLDFSEFERRSDQARLKQRYGLTGRRVLLSVGRLAKRKGIPEFVTHALPDIVAVYPDIVFLVVGDNPTQSLTHKEDVKTQIEAAMENQDLEKHVRLLGRVDRDMLIDLYHACDVFVLPAIDVSGDMEGFGIVLIEAGAAGKPVVSTKLGGITDAVVDGKSGILVEAGQWEEISDAVLTFLEDESLRQEMGRFGRERVKTELDWSIVAGRYLEHLEALIKEKY